MKRGMVSALGALLLTTLGLAVVSPALATPDTAPVESLCNTGWYVNPDETTRKPVQTEAGLEFEGSDLVHHLADVSLADLEPGDFEANPAPDQPSFFSVEVRSDKGAYGTLRHDGTQWTIVIGAGTGPDGPATAGTFTGIDPVALLADKITKWGAFKDAVITVVSFGVGYTLNPPGTVKTTVTSVSFQGKEYKLDCPAKPEDISKTGEEWRCDGYYTRGGTATHVWNPETRAWAEGEITWGAWVKLRDLNEEERENLAEQCGFTPSPDPTTPSPDTTTPSPDPTGTSASATTEAPAPAGNGTDGGGNLAKTGTPTLLIAGGGLGLLAVGGLLLLLTIRRRREDTTQTAQFPAVQ